MRLLLALLIIVVVGGAITFGLLLYALKVGSFMLEGQERKEARKMAKKMAERYKRELD